MKRESFIGLIMGMTDRGDGLVEFSVHDQRYPVDFGEHGRLRGWGPSFFITDVRGFQKGKPPSDYKNFGPDGLAKGIRVCCYYYTEDEAPIISKVVPFK